MDKVLLQPLIFCDRLREYPVCLFQQSLIAFAALNVSVWKLAAMKEVVAGTAYCSKEFLHIRYWRDRLPS